MASSQPVQRQETSHLDDPVSPVSPSPVHHNTTTAHGANDDPGALEDNGSSVDHVQEKQPPLTRWQKVKRHFRRFWWAYLIGFVILLAILLPVFFKVIIPKIIQDIVNDQELPVTGGALVALSPTMLNMSLDTSMDTPLEATLLETDLDLFNRDSLDAGEEYSPFLRITLPKLKIHHKTEAQVANQTLEILDMDELIKWFHGVFEDEEVEVGVRGDPTVKLSSLSYHPKIDTTVRVAALNYLKGFGITSMKFNMPPDEKTGYNLEGELNLPNSGALTLYLGNLTFNMLAGDVSLGYANLYDAELRPGNNTPKFDGEFYFHKLVPNLAAILDSQKDALGRGVILLHASGNSSTINGEHIPYVEKVLNTKRIPIEIPVMTLLSDVLQGFLGDKGTLQDLAGDLLGNSSLIDNIMGHWNETSKGGGEDGGGGIDLGDLGIDLKKKVKRVIPGASLIQNMMRLSKRVKKHEL